MSTCTDTTHYLYLLDEPGASFLFPTRVYAERGLENERRAGLEPGLFRIAVDRETWHAFQAAVEAKQADEHPILEAAISGHLGTWEPLDLTTYNAGE